MPQVFTGNQEICLKIKEQQVEKIFELIVEDGCTGRSELLGLLKAIAKVNKSQHCTLETPSYAKYKAIINSVCMCVLYVYYVCCVYVCMSMCV